MTAPVSASEFVGLELRKAILDGSLKPGARIPQHQIAAELGVSHVPLREAIQRLEAEGFVSIHPRRGAFVSPLSRDDAEEIFALRRVLETTALTHSVPYLTDAQVQVAQRLCASGDGLGDVVRYGEMNIQFHRSLYVGAAMPRLMGLIEGLWRNASRYSMLLRVRGDHFEQSQEGHRDLVKAVANRDTEGACTILNRHIERAASRILDLIQESAPQKLESVSTKSSLRKGRRKSAIV